MFNLIKEQGKRVPITVLLALIAGIAGTGAGMAAQYVLALSHELSIYLSIVVGCAILLALEYAPFSKLVYLTQIPKQGPPTIPKRRSLKEKVLDLVLFSPGLAMMSVALFLAISGWAKESIDINSVYLILLLGTLSAIAYWIALAFTFSLILALLARTTNNSHN